MEERWAAASRALEGARESEGIRSRLRRVGYDAGRIEEGEALLAGVTLAMGQVAEALAAQQAATEAMRRQRRQLERAYQDAVQLVRALVDPDEPWLEAAGLHEPRGASLEALLAGSQQFFSAAQGAPPELQARLGEMGLGAVAVTMAQGLAASLARAHAVQQQRMAETAETVTVRANAFETLDDWMRTFTAVARVALRDRPELLADIGLRPRGRPRKQPR